MRTSNMFRLLLLIYVVLLYAIAAAAAAAATAGRGLRVDLTHVDSARNLSKLELLQRATLRSHHRMSRLMTRMPGTMSKAAAAAAANGQSPVHAGNGEFLMELSIGTPPVPFSAIVDTGSDLVWTQCKPCVECFEQPTPVFDPSRSSSFSKLPCTGALCSALPTSMCNSDSTCEYQYSYGDSSSTQGVLGSETFTFGPTTGGGKGAVSVPKVGFGCGDTNQGGGFSQGSGLVGLGRGPLSLTSQLGVSKFSYCLTSIDDTSKKSPLLFGSMAELKKESSGGGGVAAVLSTPIAKNSLQPSFYYLSLKGITVGETLLKIPSATFDLQEDGTGGLIIDSGTSITYLEVAAYKAVKKAFLSQVKLPVADGSDVGLDLCFSMPTSTGSSDVEVPKLTFHFDGADLELPGKNYMVLDSGSGLLCLTMMGSSGMSIFGNFQQQNTQILYDLEKNTLSFVPGANCAEL